MIMQYKKSDFYYDLPEELIAQTPAEPRDSSRLLVYKRDGGVTEHKIFKNVTDYLRVGDVLVINNTKVLPARLFARTENGGAVCLKGWTGTIGKCLLSRAKSALSVKN